MPELKAADGHTFDAYLAELPSPPRAGLVLIQEIFGVNSHIRSVADRLAGEGYRVLAPALFDRIERGVELDYGPESVQRGVEMATSIGFIEKPMLDVAACVDRLKADGLRVGVIGFCWGGTLAWKAAHELDLFGAVGYYGGGISNMLDQARKHPMLLHFGERDTHIPIEVVESIRAKSYPNVEVHTYPAEHGFNCDQRESFEPISAQRAWTRSLDFFKAHL
jgi:carboxymethylenebutenolidase